MEQAWPAVTLVHLPVHASWLNQVEVVFSVIQRKVIKPADFGARPASLHQDQPRPAPAPARPRPVAAADHHRGQIPRPVRLRRRASARRPSAAAVPAPLPRILHHLGLRDLPGQPRRTGRGRLPGSEPGSGHIAARPVPDYQRNLTACARSSFPRTGTTSWSSQSVSSSSPSASASASGSSSSSSPSAGSATKTGSVKPSCGSPAPAVRRCGRGPVSTQDRAEPRPATGPVACWRAGGAVKSLRGAHRRRLAGAA